MRASSPFLLTAMLALELVIFSLLNPNFLSTANAAEILRLSAEIGLLSLATTCVIVTGGIDLSTGSLMGLSAVLFGFLSTDYNASPVLASLAVLLAGLAGGYLNGLFITRYRALPLIITLGTFSLFRGIAEGLTGGIRNFTGFSSSFLYLGQGYLFGIVPTQSLILLAAIGAFFLLLHRTIIGRSFSAIGFSQDAALFSGLPVRRRLLTVYALSGLTSAVAGLIYVARVGQAKSDAATGYELLAITAAVLGGTSIQGGIGSIAGTVLGLLVIVVLQNGLRLAAMPAELAGILTGVILLTVIGLQQLRQPDSASGPVNRRLIWVAAAAIAAFTIFAATRSLSPSAGSRITIGMMPKAKGDPYFVSCRKGAEEAAKELGVELIWDGPTDLDPARQNDIAEGWITRGVDVIAVAVENRAGLSTVLRKARARGIKVITWDADAEKDARDFLVNQATPKGIGDTITDEVAKILNNEGSFAIITGALTAANQNEWMKYMRQRLAEKYPQIKLETVRPSDDDRDKAFAETQTILRVYPQVKAIAAISAPAVPGSSEAVKQSGRSDVHTTGLSLPNLCKPYVRSGVAASVVLWNTMDLGYLTIHVAKALKEGRLKPGDATFDTPRLGRLRIEGDEVILGAPFVFTKDNIERFDF